MKSKSAYLIIAHGSREVGANQDFVQFLDRFRKAYPKRLVEGAFLELAKPDIAQGIDHCAAKGVTEIIVLPMMFFSGRHVKEHIPQIIEKAKAKHPEIDFHYAGPVSEHPMLMDLLEQKARHAKGKS